MHRSASVDALQRKESEVSAYSKVHDQAFKISKIYFQEKLLCNFLVKNENYWSFRLDFRNVNAQFCGNIPGVTIEEVFDAKIISYSELGCASRILHHKFMLHGL